MKSSTNSLTTKGQSFEELQPLLWRMMRVLTIRGYPVPPDESRDLLHDFYVEAWEGVGKRFDPAVGSFPAYVAGAFYQFAKRRVTEMRLWRMRLVDIENVREQAATDPGPDLVAETEEQVRLVREALGRLPGIQRQLLFAFASQEVTSERNLARAHRVSRYAVRKALAEGLTRLVAEIRPEVGLRADIAQLTWVECRAPLDVARRTGLPVAAIDNARAQIANIVLAGATTKPSEEKRTMNTTLDFEFGRMLDNALERRSLSLSDAELQYWRNSIEEGSLELSRADWEKLLQHPELLGELYDKLFPPTDDGALVDVVQNFAAEEAVEIADAFDFLLSTLPPNFSEWQRWGFQRLDLPGPVREYWHRRTPSLDTSPAASQVLQFGLTPATFAQALAGLSLLFNRKLKYAEAGPGRPIADALFAVKAPQPSGTVRAAVFISSEDARLAIAGTPGLPTDTGAPKAMLNWISEVLLVRPMLLEGYAVMSTASPPLTFRKLEVQRRVSPDLLARWATPNQPDQ